MPLLALFLEGGTCSMQLGHSCNTENWVQRMHADFWGQSQSGGQESHNTHTHKSQSKDWKGVQAASGEIGGSKEMRCEFLTFLLAVSICISHHWVCWLWLMEVALQQPLKKDNFSTPGFKGIELLSLFSALPHPV